MVCVLVACPPTTNDIDIEVIIFLLLDFYGEQEESDIVAALVRHLKSVKASLPDGIFDDPPTIIQGISQEELTSEQKQNIQQINSAFIKVCSFALVRECKVLILTCTRILLFGAECC